MNMIAGIICSVFFGIASFGYAKQYKMYQIDYSPIAKYPKLFAELKDSRAKVVEGDATRKRFSRHVAILEEVLKKNPNWVDGLWLLGSETFQLGSSYTAEKDLPLARKIFKRGQQVTERCLRIQPSNPLCKLFLGSSLAKIGTIDGVFASLDKAERIEKLWLDVTKSPYNFKFTDYISMQGGARYALGIFYRLVPDYAVLDWLYGVRGDLERSVLFHKRSLAIDDPNLPCSNLMLGAALVCYGDDEDSASAKKEGLTYLLRAARRTKIVYSVNSSTCQADSKKLLRDHDMTCGYSIAKQQEKISEDQLAQQN